MKCFIYRNLNRKGYVYSLKALEGSYKGRVVAHSSTITIENPEFVVSKAGQDRVRREKQRNVHAGVVGNVLGIGNTSSNNRLPHTIPHQFSRLPNGISITYNPWKYDTFVDRSNKTPVHQAKIAQFYYEHVEAFHILDK